jgi:hypothetical protein
MSGTTPRTGDRPVSMATLLAAARAATAVSTPPTPEVAAEPATRAVPSAEAVAADVKADRPPHTAAAA